MGRDKDLLVNAHLNLHHVIHHLRGACVEFGTQTEGSIIEECKCFHNRTSVLKSLNYRSKEPFYSLKNFK